MARELGRLSRVVGKEGKIHQRASLDAVSGFWSDSIDSVNELISDLVHPTSETARVIGAVAQGDLSQTMALEVKDRPLQGEFLRTAKTINKMVDQLGSFASEVTRVAREVGAEGKLGGQAKVKGVAGTWKDLTDSVNMMAGNLTGQVRNIAEVATAVPNGDLSHQITVDVKGEILELKNTINTMVDQLNSFASEVTRVAREVGTEGKLGGQADVPGVAGVWKNLTDNVNFMARNLTTQVRGISRVVTAVANGDLSQKLLVDAKGEVAALAETINDMTDTLGTFADQVSSVAREVGIEGKLGGQAKVPNATGTWRQLTPLVSAHHGAFFMMDQEGEGPVLKLVATYAYKERKSVSNRFHPGEGLVGQCALEKKTILLSRVPSDYIQISSGLGESPPLNIIVLPVLFEGEVKAVIELASFNTFSAIHQIYLDTLTEAIGVVLNMIGANMRTEQLLQQSQSLTQELQSQSQELTVQQEELKRTNSALEKQALELEEKATELEEQNT